MTKNVFPSGLDEKKIREIIAYYDQQTDEEIAAEIDAGFEQQASEELQAGEPETHPVEIYYQVIKDGLQGLSQTTLAEIADFVYFMRKRSLHPDDNDDELSRALLSAEMKHQS
jgi:hypothetical protein